MCKPPAGATAVHRENLPRNVWCLAGKEQRRARDVFRRTAPLQQLDAQNVGAGLSNELHHLYLARGLSHAGRGDFELHGEEADLEVVWVAFDELLDAVLQQQVREGPLAAAVLTYEVLRQRGEL